MRASLRDPLERLADLGQRFVRLTDVRLLCVDADTRLFSGAMQTLLATEHLADNTSPLIPVDVSAEADEDRPWEEATDSLRQAHAAVRDGGAPFEPLDDRPMGRQGSANFAVQVMQCLGSVCAPAQGLLVLLMANGRVTEAWLSRLAETVFSERASGVRFMLLTKPSPALEPWLDGLQKGVALRSQCCVDEGRQTQEMRAEVEAEEELGPGMLGAWPRGVRPPPFPNPSGASVAADTAAADAEDQAAAETAQQLRLHVKRAAIAMRVEDGPEAIREQAAARDLCLETGQLRDAISMELILGAYMVQLEQSQLAQRAFASAAARGHEAEHWDLVAQARCASGSVFDRDNNPSSAVREYHAGIEAAQKAEKPHVAMGAYWEAGQIAVRLGLDLDAIALWLDAMGYAASVDPSELRGSRAKDIAEELSALLAKHRRFSDAREVERAAAAFEAPS